MAFRTWVRHGNLPRKAARRGAGVLAVLHALVEDWGPLLHITAGWALLTWGLSAALPLPVWRISAGLYVLSWAGWRYLAELFLAGIYVLSRDDGDT